MIVVDIYSSPTGQGRKRSLPMAGKCYRWSATVASDLSQTSLTFFEGIGFLKVFVLVLTIMYLHTYI